MKQYRSAILATMIIFCSAVWAQSENPTSSKVSSDVKEKVEETTADEYCPEPNQLEKKELRWSAPGGWISYSDSLAKKISYFFGARWTGVKVGKIVCVYHTDDPFEFPVALERQQLVWEPKTMTKETAVGWRENQEGYRICKSYNVKDCPFVVKKAEPEKDIYEDIRFYKQDKPNQLDTK